MARKAFWPRGKGFCHAGAWGLVATTKLFPTLAKRKWRVEVPKLHQVLRCGHSAAAYQAGTMTTKCVVFFKSLKINPQLIFLIGDLALFPKDTVITIANLSSAVAGMLWQATCMSLTVVWRSLRSAVSVLWFTAEQRGASSVTWGWLPSCP